MTDTISMPSAEVVTPRPPRPSLARHRVVGVIALAVAVAFGIAWYHLVSLVA